MDIKLTPYLMLNGDAKEAVEFYKDVFGAKVESIELVKDWPQEFEGEVPEGYDDHVMHAHLSFGSSSWLMLADVLPGQTYTPGSTITIMLDIKTVPIAETLYKKLTAGGEIVSALSETSYSPAYAQVKDKFGVEWQIVTEHPGMD
ncbi:VOC family protein [Alkalibacterium olivapovliticus]|uniref:PhnB protein n=1 Tax=Alkalibacterium olivapovliticus TaxID=99907 RepID=A0A2T0W675_9LACT|nr:VOC family protein [Alkalibacterium olivapovliticus]PRY81363.1 PhnB protein [Alkalibacterium olivapovliticus]